VAGTYECSYGPFASIKCGRIFFLLNEELLTSEEGPCCGEFVTLELPKLKGRDHLEDPFVDGKLIFCYINEVELD
jgi:hypothetical protein